MALKVNLEFGGYITATTSAEVEAAVTKYFQLAVSENLLTLGFDLVMQDQADLAGVRFRYRKEAMNESVLQVFNDSWQALSVLHNIVRDETNIEYYEV